MGYNLHLKSFSLPQTEEDKDLLKYKERKELNLPLPNTSLMNMCMLLAIKKREEWFPLWLVSLFLTEVGRTSQVKDVAQKVAYYNFLFLHGDNCFLQARAPWTH